MNKVILVGRLTKDPELRRTNNDIPFVLFTVAVNRISRQAEKQADFINCVVWRNQAENLAKYMRKGSLIGVEGSLQTRSYDDANGVRRFVTEVVCDNIQFLEPKSSRGDYDQNYIDMYQNDQNYATGDTHRNQNEYGNNEYKNTGDEKSDTKDPFEDIGNDFNVSNDDLPF